jgi:regulator of replication initiation timing
MYKMKRTNDILKSIVEAEQTRNNELAERVGELMEENTRLRRENKKLRNMTYKKQKRLKIA